jgi:hypothetical protein
VDPVLDLLLLIKSGSGGNRTRDLWVCSQEVWPLGHRGGGAIQEHADIYLIFLFNVYLLCPFLFVVILCLCQRCITGFITIFLPRKSSRANPEGAVTAIPRLVLSV